MAKELLDWYGDPIPDLHRTRNVGKNKISLVVDADGTKWWEMKGGDRLPYDAPYLRVEDGGKVVYDSRLPIPADAKILPGYIGEQRKRVSPELVSMQAASA
jgi:hypothetical protein